MSNLLPAAFHNDSNDTLFVREWRPAARPRGAFLFLHGMESHSGWFVELASRLVAEGWAAVSFDRTGWGKSLGHRGHLASYQDFVEEASLVASETREKFGSLHLAGMSWGGMAALYLGLRRGWLFDSLTLLAPGLSTRRDLGIADKARIAGDFLRKGQPRMVEPRFNPEHFTKNPERREYIKNDPLRVRQVSTSFCIETVKMRRFIAETAGRRRLPPALCLLAGDDAIVDNRRSAEICRRAGAAVELLADSAHTIIFERPAETADHLSKHAVAAQAKPQSETARRRVWIIGGGAVGGAVGTLMSFGGVETGILIRPAQLEPLRRNGFVMNAGNARRRSGHNLLPAARPEDLPPDPDLVVLAVKSFDTRAALRQIADAVPPGAVIASLQNGIGNEDALAEAFPGHTIVAGSICAGLESGGPGAIVWPDDRGGTGGALHRGDPERAKTLWSEVFDATGMENRWYEGDNAGPRLKWSKLMLNIGFNALNSVTGLTSAELLRDQEWGCLAVRALREGFYLMGNLSLEPVDLPGFPISKLRLAVKLPINFARLLMAWQAGRRPEAAFSMRQDILKKRQHTEIDELNGKIVQLGRSLSLPMEANVRLVEMVKKFL